VVFKQHRFVPGGLIGLLAAVLALALRHTGGLEGWEHTAWGWRVRTFAPRSPPHPQVKVILLDQPSLDWGKKENGWAWPWPRTVYSAALEFCRRGGAKAIAFDVLFTEPSPYEAADDLALGEALRRTSNFVGALYLSARSGEATQWPATALPAPPVIQGLESWLTPHRAGPVTMPRATFPIPEVATNAFLLANVSDQPDADGVFRRAAQFRIFDGKAVPALGLAAFLAGERAAGTASSLRLNSGWLEVGNRRVPINDHGAAILRFHGNNGAHETVSAAAVIQSELRLQAGERPVLDPAVFKDAYVFFGFSAPGLLDAHPCPVNRAYPGVEIHATSLDNLLTAAFMREPPTVVVVLATLLLGALSGGVIALSRKAWQSVLAFVLLVPVPIAAGFAAYPLGWWWPVVDVEGAVVGALVGGLILNYATEGRQRAFLKRAFKHYLGAEVIDRIVADPTRLRLGGEKRELTIFFSDIEKFSSFSEKLDPETLTGLLNAYLSDMTDIILEEGGYLDKYIGDAIVAFWNAPADQPDHAIRAVRTVLRCQRMLVARRADYQQKTGVLLKARIGLHTGEVTVGNMGSRDRFNYTILGDAANLASRLEGANKVFGTYNLISELTWQRLGGQFVGRELGRIRVVGREQPVGVYEVIGFAGEAVLGHVVEFESGLRQCLRGQWREALACFERHPEDPPSAVYAAHCRKRLSAGVEPGPWDGVWSLTEK
jgi:adenylate cyclase